MHDTAATRLPKPSSCPWFAAGLRFECTGCGNCCTGGPGFIWISAVETERLAAHLNLTVAQLQREHCRKLAGGVSLKEKPPTASGEYDCTFLRTEILPLPADGSRGLHRRRHCGIYPVRPLQCRTWPFWTGLLASPQVWQEAGRRCPGINKGKLYSYRDILALRDATDWPKP